MTAIVPRWEWRTFGHRFDAAEAVFEAVATPGGTHESSEIYILGDEPFASTIIVKIRDELVDVKVLREVSVDGLERWEPVLKVGVPASGEDLGRVASVLGLDSPVPSGGVATMDEVVAWLTGTGHHRAVDVHKRRVRYRIDGCTAEVTDVTADDRTGMTVAIESEDAAAVLAAVRRVGLQDYVNTNYERALAALLAGERARHAVIDVGTNSVKALLAEQHDDGTWETVLERAEVTRIGEGQTAGGDIAPAAVARTATALRDIAAEAHRLGAIAIVTVGTAWLRAVRDPDAVIAAIRAGSGLTIEPISGDEEGRLSYVAVASSLGLGDAPSVVFETGGGSSQFTFGRGSQVDERFSLPVGAVGYTERFGLASAVAPARVAEASAAIAADLSSIAGRPQPDALFALGGAVTNMAAVQRSLAPYDPTVIEGSAIYRAEVDRQIGLYASMDAEARRAIVGLQPQRAEVILAGACIVRSVMDLLGRSSMTISTRGLRHGLLVDRFGD